jgi:glutamyl-tRNA synthetase
VRALAEDDLVRRLLPFLQRAGLVADPPASDQLALLVASVPVLQSRLALLTDAADLLRPLMAPEDSFVVDPEVATKQLTSEAAPVLAATLAALEPLSDWAVDSVQAAIDAALLEQGLGLKRGKAYAPVRAAVLGAPKTLPLPESIALLGKDRTLRRLRAAQALAV